MKTNLDLGTRLIRFVLVFLAVLPLTSSIIVLADAEPKVIVNNTQQTTKVQGTVVDENGDPMIGVTIKVKNGSTGSITDLDGHFSINVKAGTLLVFTSVGYFDQTIKASANMTVKMKPDAIGLDEVVAVGYGSMKKKDLTGAVSQVNNEIITLTPSSNAMQALQGRVAGLDITKTSGQAGSGVNIQLRGNRSISSGGTPLFIIDGMPGDYEALNPNDIETIDVLKDASSTAIYGSQGANGVVIITTKKGQKGKLNINFDTYVGINGWSTMPKMNSAYQNVYTSMYAQQVSGQVYDDFDLQLQQAALEKGNFIDWTDALLKTGVTQNYSVSVTGGNEKTQGYMSFNYSGEEGQYEKDDYKVYSTTLRLNHEVTKWLSAGVHVQGNFRDQSKADMKLENALRASPFGELYYTDAEEAASYGKQVGDIKAYPITGDNKQVNLLLNSVGDAYRNEPQSQNIYIQPYIRISPLKGLSLESRFSAAFSNSKKRTYIGYESYSFYDKAGTGALNATKSETAEYTSATINRSDSHTYTWENILTYNFTLAKVHDFMLTGVTSYSSSESESSNVSATGIPSNAMYWTNLEKATGTKTISSSYSMGKTMAYVGRLNYSYLGKYLLSASVRYDGSSVLAKGHRWSTFPAFSAGWRISDEAFMDNTRNWLDNLKLRLSYGETGGANISAYNSVNILQSSNSGLGDQQLTKYAYSQNLSNPSVTWERSKSWNFGVDATFLDGMIDIVADYYVTNTGGVLWKQSVPITNGGYTASTYYETTKNIADTRNRGFELQLTGRPFVAKKSGGFSWVSTLTFSTNKEEVRSLGEGAAEYITNGDYTLHIGDPIHSYYAYNIAGVWQKGEEADAAVFGKQPGDLKVNVPDMYKKADGVWVKRYLQDDGVTYEETEYNAENPYSVNANDKVIIGHSSPDWSLGWHNTWSYKGFDLTVYMYMRQGQMIYYDPMTWYSSSGGNFPEFFNYWTEDNASNDFPALNAARNWKDDEYYTSRAYVDGSFFKIKNITLSYTLPMNIVRRIGLQKLRIYGTITDPFVKANSHFLKDYDPEMGGQLNYPLTKQLVFGLNVTL